MTTPALKKMPIGVGTVYSHNGKHVADIEYMGNKLYYIRLSARILSTRSNNGPQWPSVVAGMDAAQCVVFGAFAEAHAAGVI